ncbi:hypothetical protein J6590_083398 [Homalodisca vitripennis]|nr:hypothetical protein J6590_083398 [Homalodisca vitripennis]
MRGSLLLLLVDTASIDNDPSNRSGEAQVKLPSVCSRPLPPHLPLIYLRRPDNPVTVTGIDHRTSSAISALLSFLLAVMLLPKHELFP